MKQNSSIVSSIKTSQLLSSVFKRHQQIKSIHIPTMKIASQNALGELSILFRKFYEK